MSEELKLLPCPVCNSTKVLMDEYEYVSCEGNCGFEAKLVDWNALPRALTWTTEPPKVAGWYWYADTFTKEVVVCCVWECPSSKRIMVIGKTRNHYIDTLVDVKWAGPIPMPKEPNP